MDKQFPELCLTFGGIMIDIQILRQVIMFRITKGLPHGTSNTDTWRLKLSTRCQLLVDRSELCTKCFFKFSQFIRKASKKEKIELRKDERNMFWKIPIKSNVGTGASCKRSFVSVVREIYMCQDFWLAVVKNNAVGEMHLRKKIEDELKYFSYYSGEHFQDNSE